MPLWFIFGCSVRRQHLLHISLERRQTQLSVLSARQNRGRCTEQTGATVTFSFSSLQVDDTDESGAQQKQGLAAPDAWLAWCTRRLSISITAQIFFLKVLAEAQHRNEWNKWLSEKMSAEVMLKEFAFSCIIQTKPRLWHLWTCLFFFFCCTATQHLVAVCMSLVLQRNLASFLLLLCFLLCHPSYLPAAVFLWHSSLH